MWLRWILPLFCGAVAVGFWLVPATSSLAANDGYARHGDYYGRYGYKDYGLGARYYGDYDRDLVYRPRFHESPVPPPPDFGPALPYFPHDLRYSGAQWYLFSRRYKAFPKWSGYNDTYPRGTGTEVFFIRPDNYY